MPNVHFGNSDGSGPISRESVLSICCFGVLSMFLFSIRFVTESFYFFPDPVIAPILPDLPHSHRTFTIHVHAIFL